MAVELESGALPSDFVEVAVRHCGLCHSDLSMAHNDWGMTRFPFVGGHEAVGQIVEVGPEVRGLKVGQWVGVGWFAGSCLHCRQCLSGRHNLCGSAEQTIVGRPGAFAERVRCQATWAVPLPTGLAPAEVGPLFCGGITVFAPIFAHGVKPTDRVAVVGIGGLGHLAVQFLAKWGCDVTALTSTGPKADDARRLGAHHILDSRSPEALRAATGRFDFILSTVNVTLDWNALLGCLTPGGRLHVVGAALEPMPIPAFTLIGGQKSVSGSPLGSPATVATMLDFCARHGIAPVNEHFPMSRLDEAFARLESGAARYRIVLDADWA